MAMQTRGTAGRNAAGGAASRGAASRGAASKGAAPTRMAPASPRQVAPAPERKRGSRIPTLVWLLLVLAAAAGGWYVGYMLMGGANYGALEGKAALSEDELDSAVGTYTIDGKTYSVTAREAIAQESSLDAVRNADGTYAMPSAEDVIAAARMAVVQAEVERRGISVSDEEVASYAAQTFGSDDFAKLAVTYTMDEATVRARMRESAAMAKLRAEVVGEVPPEPQMPKEPSGGNSPAEAAEYAAYIIDLAGGEWDAERDDWASQDGPFAQALHDYELSKEASSYAAATTAYEVAYQLYNANVTSANTEWTAFVNSLLCGAKVAVSSLVS